MKNFNPNNPNQLLKELSSHPLIQKNIDSAHLSFAHEFQQLLMTDGGDDDFAHIQNTDELIIYFISELTDEDINNYDESDEETDADLFLNTYLRIKNQLLNIK